MRPNRLLSAALLVEALLCFGVAGLFVLLGLIYLPFGIGLLNTFCVLLGVVGLLGNRATLVCDYSGGTKQKLAWGHASRTICGTCRSYRLYD